MYKIKGSIDLHDTARSGYAVSQLMKALGISDTARDSSEKQVIIDCCPEEFSEKAVVSALRSLAVFTARGRICVTRTSEEDTGEDSQWRYVFDTRKKVFERMNANIVWETDRTGAFRGRGELKLVLDPDPVVRKENIRAVEATLEDEFESISISEYGHAAVYFESQEFEADEMAYSLELILEHIEEAYICIGRVDDGPDMDTVKRWKFTIHDGKLACQCATSINWE